MKKITIVLMALVFAACSSKPKADETAATPSDTEKKVMEATDTTATSTTTEADTKAEKKAAKKAKQAAETDTTSSEVTSSPSANSDFPSITGTEKSSVTCTNKSDSRKISVLNVTEGGCGVVYNKMGEDKTVAIAKSDLNYCDTVSSKIKTNLEGAGFDCGGGAATATAPSSSSDTPTTNQ